jgi:hypothetical protein
MNSSHLYVKFAVLLHTGVQTAQPAIFARVSVDPRARRPVSALPKYLKEAEIRVRVGQLFLAMASTPGPR